MSDKKPIRLSSAVSAALIASALFLPPLTYAAGTTTKPIANSGLETAEQNSTTTPYAWKRGFWGTNDAAFSYSVPGEGNSRAAKVEITAYTDGDAKWFFDDISVLPEERYIFSDRYTANVPADIVARYTLQNGEYQYAYLGTSVVSPGWTGYETLPFMIPEDAVSLTIFHLIHETGSLSIDSASLLLLPPFPALPAAIQEPEVSPLVPVNGGAVPLSYITGTMTNTPVVPPPPPPVIPSVPTPEKKLVIPIIGAALSAVREMTSPLVYSAHAETETAEDSSAKAGAQTSLAQAITSLPNQNGALSDRTMLFLGLSFLLVSLGVPLLTNLQNSEMKREEHLWEP